MDLLHDQEKQPEIRKLQNLLQNVSKETKQEHEWQLLENSLLLRMEQMEKRPSRLRDRLISIRFAPMFPAKIAALVTAVCLIFVLGLGTFYTAYRQAPEPLAESRILGIKGDVTVNSPQNGIIQKDALSKASLLSENLVFETAANATCIVQIDEGSSFILSEKSRITVSKANTRDIEFFLEKGTIFASVSKRTSKQSFTVRTDDAECKVIGTVFSVSVKPAEKKAHTTNLTVIEGHVNIADRKFPDIHETVHSGQTISMQNNTLNKPAPATENLISNHTISLLELAQEITGVKRSPAGIIDITSQPVGAKIFIGNRCVGETPLAFTHPAGTHSVKLTLPGFESWQEECTLSELNSTFISAELHKEQVEEPPQQKVARKRKSRRRNVVLKSAIPAAQPAKSTEPTKNFGFIMNPAFVEALMHMTVGEHQKALGILDSLKELPEISITEKIRIMSKISACYKSMGNFENTRDILTRRYNSTADKSAKSNLLWEIIIVKANCLQDYEGAEKDILTYIENYPRGTWIESAYAKLGEIQYITSKYTKAVGTLQYHINLFKSSPVVEKSLYTLANIMRLDIKDHVMAIKWYSKLLKEYPSSNYYGNALFERAECFEKTNNRTKARNDYKKYLDHFPDGHLKALCLSRLSSQE